MCIDTENHSDGCGTAGETLLIVSNNNEFLPTLKAF